jgi:hypothetical protein
MVYYLGCQLDTYFKLEIMKLQKEDGYYYLMEDGNDIAIATTDQSFIDELGAMKLSKENCDEIFGVVDVEELADEYIVIKPKHREHEHNLAVSAYINGFNKAMELNKDKLFTVEDMVGYFDWHKKQRYVSHEPYDIHEYIQSLQQPTEIEIEIEMEKYGYCEGCRKAGMWHCTHADTCGYAETRERPKLDANDCLILKKK